MTSAAWRREGRGNKGSAASISKPASIQAADHELAATTCGIASGVRNKPR